MCYDAEHALPNNDLTEMSSSRSRKNCGAEKLGFERRTEKSSLKPLKSGQL